MRILILEAYDNGSHKQFLNGLTANSRHSFSRLGLPARKWKWRMRGSAIYFAQQLTSGHCPDVNDIDLIFTSDMTAVADLRALLPNALKDKPIICYFHENQLTYPIPDEFQRDYQYGFTNITSCLTADAVWFNSRYHLDSFLEAVEALLKKMPDYVPTGIVETINRRATVMPLGLSPELFQLPAKTKPKFPPVILWNHRWEYDKNPDEFFEVLFDIDRMGIEFRLIVAGENFRTAPPIFAAAKNTLTDHIDHFGYVSDQGEYQKLLGACDIVVSTSIHEFFGLSVLEAIAAGCCPLLPNRLSYPELICAEFHHRYLYNNRVELREKLIALLTNPIAPLPEQLSRQVSELAWPDLIEKYDDAFDCAVL
jgi:glycosyltransferase involved in cell wall biosynthesis